MTLVGCVYQTSMLSFTETSTFVGWRISAALWCFIIMLFCQIFYLYSCDLDMALSHNGNIIMLQRSPGWYDVQLLIFHPSIFCIRCIPFMGLWFFFFFFFAGANPSCVWARTGYSLDKSPAHWWQNLAGRIWTSNLPITSRPALPAELPAFDFDYFKLNLLHYPIYIGFGKKKKEQGDIKELKNVY